MIPLRGQMLLRELLADRRGVAGIIAAVAMPMLLGSAALAVDTGLFYREVELTQRAADIAALAGAETLARTGDKQKAETTARLVALANGYDSTRPEHSVDAAATDRSVTVVVRSEAPLYFGRILKLSAPTVERHAAAAFASSSACLIATDNAAPVGIKVDNMGEIRLSGCGLQSNSPTVDAGSSWAPKGSITLNSGRIEADEIRAVGRISQSNSGSNTMLGGQQPYSAPVPDPYADLMEPTVGTCNRPSSYTSWTPHLQLSPGVYCGGLFTQNVPKITFAPGDYLITGGDMTINNAQMTGTGVTFYIRDGALKIQNYSNNVSLTAPTTGPHAGIVVFQGRNVAPAKSTSTLVGGSSFGIDGALYLPSGALQVTNNAKLNVKVAGGAGVVAPTIYAAGSGTIRVEIDAAGGAAASGNGQPRLVN